MPFKGEADRVELVLIIDRYLLAPAAAVKDPTITVLLGVTFKLVGGCGGVAHAGKAGVVALPVKDLAAGNLEHYCSFRYYEQTRK